MSTNEYHHSSESSSVSPRLVPFLLILIILEEALPLIVLYAPFLLPSTCILPNQRARITWKRDDAQYNARSEARRILLSAGSLQSIASTGVAGMPKELITSLAKFATLCLLPKYIPTNYSPIGCLDFPHVVLLSSTARD